MTHCLKKQKKQRRKNLHGRQWRYRRQTQYQTHMKNSKETVFLPFSTDKGIILEGRAHILELGNLGKCWCRPRNFSLFPSRRCCRISSFLFLCGYYPLKEKFKRKTSISVQNPKMSQMSQTPLTMLWKSYSYCKKITLFASFRTTTQNVHFSFYINKMVAE